MNAPSPASPRYHDLDALRSAMMLLGIFFHAALSYMDTAVPWFVKDRSTHILVDLACWISHAFRLPVFFLLSGFFARLLCERHGLSGLLRHRGKRVLLPFLVALPPIAVSLVLLWTWGHSVKPPPVPLARFPVIDTTPALRNLSPAYLWFLYYLLMLTLGAAILVRFGPSPGARSDRLFRVLASTPFLVALPTATVLHFMSSIEADTPLHFPPVPAILAFYAILFAFGWFLHRQPDLVLLHRRLAWVWTALAVALVPLLAFFLSQADPDGAVRSSPWRPAALYASALFTWTMAFALLGLFTRFFSTPRPWVRWLSDASYWSYLLHLPVAACFQILTSELPWPGPLKYLLLVSAPTLAVCLATYRWGVRSTFIGRALNGERARSSGIAPLDH